MSPVTRRRAGGARRNARPESTGSGEDGALAREHKRSCRKMTSQPHQPKPPVHKKIATGQGRRARNPEKKQEQKVELLQAVPRAGGNHDQARRGRDTGLDLESWRGTARGLACGGENGGAREAVSSGCFFCFWLGRQPDTTGVTAGRVPPSAEADSIDLLAAAGGTAAAAPSPRADPDFFIPARACAGSLGSETPSALGRRRTRPA